MRLMRALERLDECRGALADLALEVGFSSQSHFTDAFRGAFGVAPGSARAGESTGCARLTVGRRRDSVRSHSRR
jgi:transcriptional regulator GlxA family with amidase domain